MRSWAILIARQGVVSALTAGGALALALLLSPSDFALYGYAGTAMLIAAAVGDLGLGAAYVKGDLPKDRLGAALALQLVVWISLALIAGVVAIALHAYGFDPGIVALLLV